MGYYSLNRSRRDGKLSWPCWLTDSGRRTHKVVKQPSISLVQDKESPPAKTDVLTTMLRHQHTMKSSDKSNLLSKLPSLQILQLPWENARLLDYNNSQSSVDELIRNWRCWLLVRKHSLMSKWTGTKKQKTSNH